MDGRQKRLALRGLLSVFIVILHARNLSVFYRDSLISDEHVISWAGFLQELISNQLARASTPLFFIFAGYHLFLSSSRSTLSERVSRRFGRLLLPYLFFSGLTLVLFEICRGPSSFGVLFQAPTQVPSAAQALNKWILHPLPSQLWFVRNLLLFFCLAPLLANLLSASRFLNIAIAAVGCLVFPYWPNESLWTGLNYFYLGAVIARHGPFQLSPRLFYPALATWLSMSLWNASATMNSAIPAVSFFPILQRIAGPLTLWLGFDRLSSAVRLHAEKFAQYSFIIYLAHEPLQGGLIKLILLRLGSSPLAHFCTWLITPVLTIGLIIAGARLYASASSELAELQERVLAAAARRRRIAFSLTTSLISNAWNLIPAKASRRRS